MQVICKMVSEYCVLKDRQTVQYRQGFIITNYPTKYTSNISNCLWVLCLDGYDGRTDKYNYYIPLQDLRKTI